MKLNEMLAGLSDLQQQKTTRDSVYARVPRAEFAAIITRLIHENALRLAFLYATDDRALAHVFTVHAIISNDVEQEWLVLETELPENDAQYPSITRTVMAAHWYERYMSDMFGIVPEGHPDPRRLVHHENIPAGTHPLRKDFAWNTVLDHANEPYPMHHVEGEGIFEIPVGPIHAGVIEPGHFRFNVAGERIITLEGKLFFTHKGVEKLIEGKTPEQTLPFVERISGDASASHSLAFAQALEAIAESSVSERARKFRTLVCELERITMHVHDLANIAGNGTGYTFMSAQGFRVKERLMELSGRLCGNRFWRGLIVPGGVSQDFSAAQLKDIAETVNGVAAEMNELLQTALQSDGLRERLETTGLLSLEGARALGAVGLAARASGLDVDVRRDHPYAGYSGTKFEPVVLYSGDVYARYCARITELEQSAGFVQHICAHPGAGAVRVDCKPQTGTAFSAVESWRGEIITAVHLENGIITRCAPRDPSFCNWALFGLIGPGNIIPDFPLCNKTLSLSYSGNDL